MVVLTTIATIIGFVVMCVLLIAMLVIIAAFSPGTTLACIAVICIFWNVTKKART